MTINERKYRKQLDELIDKSLEASLNEVFNSDYEMPDVSDLSQFRYKHAGAEKGKDFTTAVADDNYTPVKYGPMNHGWKTVTAVNGMMGWVDRKGRQHPIMKDIGWLDSCSNFSPGHSAIATGMKDGIRYYVYPNGRYVKDSKRFVRTSYDRYGNKRTTDDIASNIKNHDGTATTQEITTNVKSASNPGGKWDPTKLIRYSTPNKQFFMEFVMTWAQHFGNDSQYRTGFNDEDNTYFIDIQNGPGVYNSIVELDQNLGSSIKMNQIDRETWNQRNKYNNASGRFFESYIREEDFVTYDDVANALGYNQNAEPEPFPEPEYSNEEGGEENPTGDPKELTNGSIVFGKNIPFDNQEEGGQEGQEGQEGGQGQQQKPNQSFEIETMQIDYYGFFNNTTAQWVLRIDQGLWLNADDGSKMGTVKVEPNLAQWNFTLTHNNGNQFNFVIRDNQLKDSGKGYEIANNIQLFFSTPNTMSKNRGIGAMDIIYTHKMKDNISLFENRVYKNLLNKIRVLNEKKELYPWYDKSNDRPVDDSGSYWNYHDEEINIGREIGARREVTINGKKEVLTINGTVIGKKVGPTGKDCYLIQGKSGKTLWVTDDDVNTIKKRPTLAESNFKNMLKRIISEMVSEYRSDLEGSATWDVGNAMYNAGLSEEECELCNALDDTYRIRFTGSEDSGDWDTPPSYDHEANEDDIQEVERDICAIPDEKVKAAMLKQFRSWLETAEPDMDFAEGPDPDRFRDDF